MITGEETCNYYHHIDGRAISQVAWCMSQLLRAQRHGLLYKLHGSTDSASCYLITFELKTAKNMGVSLLAISAE